MVYVCTTCGIKLKDEKYQENLLHYLPQIPGEMVMQPNNMIKKLTPEGKKSGRSGQGAPAPSLSGPYAPGDQGIARGQSVPESSSSLA